MRDPRGGEFVGYRIDDDSPGLRLRLKWQGPPPRRLARLAPILALALALVAAALAVWQFFGPEIAQAVAQQRLDPNVLAPLAFALIVGSIIAANALRFVFQFARANGYYQTLAWDSRDAEFLGAYRGAPLIGWRAVRAPLAQIERIRFSIGPEGEGPLRIEAQMEFTAGRERVEAVLRVEHVDQRAEAMDLLFRIARIAGLSNYFVSRVSARRLDVIAVVEPAARPTAPRKDSAEYDDADDAEAEAESSETDDEDAFDAEDFVPQLLPIPADRSMARYEMNAPPSGFREPEVALPEFDPAVLAEAVTTERVTNWEPGKLVRIERAAWPLAACIALPAAGGVVVGLIASWPAYGWIANLAQPAVLPPWVVFCAAALITYISLYVYFRPRMFAREVAFDWGHRMVRWRLGARAGEASLAAVQGLSLGGVRTERKGFGGNSQVLHEYRAQLRMILPAADELVIETDHWSPNPNEPFDQLLPFGVALARALGVPFSVADSPEAGAGGLARLGRGQAILLCVGLLLASSWLGWRWYQRVAVGQAEDAARIEIEAAGGKFTRLSSRTFRELHELKNVWRVEFPNGIDDDTLARLIEPLSRVKRLDLDLSGAPISDRGAQQMHLLKNALAIDLSGTRVTDATVESFFRLQNVEILNLSGTSIREHGIASVAMNHKLAVLLLGGTRANDADMLNLRICSSLKYVNVANASVSAAGAANLRGALPNVVVEGAAE